MIDLSKLESLGAPTWLEAIELRRQVGISAGEFGGRLSRFADITEDTDVTDDVELMETLAAALWLLHRREHPETTYTDFIGALTLDEFAEASTTLEAPTPGNRSERRAKPPKKPKRR